MTQAKELLQKHIHVPFSPDQVVSLNEYQQSHVMHPFTCRSHAREDHRDDGTLVATVSGWICPYCDYRQDWAHAWMADKSWQAMNPRKATP